MKQEDLFFHERTGEMRFADARPRRPSSPTKAPPPPVPAPAQAAKPPRARKPKAPSSPVAPPSYLVVPATHMEMEAHLLGAARRMCRHLRRERSGSGLPSQFERGERIVALIERLHRGEAVTIDEALEVESMASVLFLASTRDNLETGQPECHRLSWHAAEVMDWALRCAIGRQAAEGFVAACRRFTEFLREP